MRSGAVAILSILLIPFLPLSGAQAETGVIVGRVVDADGNPVTQVDAFVIYPHRPRDVELRADGTFRHEVPPGNISGAIIPSLTGASPWGDVTIGCDDDLCHAVRAGETLWLNLTLPRAGHVEGVVRDASGTPVAGAVVHADVPSTFYTLHTTTSDEGAFRLALGPAARSLSVTPPEGLLAGGTTLDCHAERNPTCVEVAPGETQQLDIVLPGRTELRGYVRDAAGNPVAQAEVRFDAAAEEFDWVEVDEDGTYRMVVPTEARQLGVTLDHSWGIDPLAVPLRLDCDAGECPAFAPGQVVWLNLTLPRGGILRGSVHGASGEPASALNAILWGEEDHSRTVSLESDGSYELVVPAGWYALAAREEGPEESYAPGRTVCPDARCAEVRPNETTWLNLTLQKGGELRVETTLATGASDAFAIHVWNAEEAVREMYYTSDGLLRLPAGRYAIGVLGIGVGYGNVEGSCYHACVEVREGETTTHELHVGAATPTVVNLVTPDDRNVRGEFLMARGDTVAEAYVEKGAHGFAYATPGVHDVAAFRLEGDEAWALWEARVQVPDAEVAHVNLNLRPATVLARATLGPLPSDGYQGWSFADVYLLDDGARTALVIQGALLPPDLEVQLEGAAPAAPLMRGATVAVLPTAGVAAGPHEWRVRAGGAEAVLVATTRDEAPEATAPATSPPVGAAPDASPPRSAGEKAPVPLPAYLPLVALAMLVALRRRGSP